MMQLLCDDNLIPRWKINISKKRFVRFVKREALSLRNRVTKVLSLSEIISFFFNDHGMSACHFFFTFSHGVMTNKLTMYIIFC